MKKIYAAIVATLALTIPAVAGHDGLVSSKTHCSADSVRVVEQPLFRTYFTGAYDMPVVSPLPSSQPAILYPTGPYPQGARTTGVFMRQPAFLPI